MELTRQKIPHGSSPLARLQAMGRPRVQHERCEMCGNIIPPEHQHALELSSRQVRCACDACAILFSSEQSSRFRRIPRDVQSLEDFQLTDPLWESLHIPINLAFFYKDSGAGRVIAMYPSPAGATESLLTIDAWTDLVRANPVLDQMQSDVEALLINRIGEQRAAFIVPIDQCYKLVGLIRMHWQGLSGGFDVWREINGFFGHLQKTALPARVAVNA